MTPLAVSVVQLFETIECGLRVKRAAADVVTKTKDLLNGGDDTLS